MSWGIQLLATNYPTFDRQELELLPLSERQSDLDLSVILPLEGTSYKNESLSDVARRIVKAKRHGSPTILMMGAHVIRRGVQRYLIDMMKKGYISCIATNGAGVIHDFEFASMGATTESVARYIENGHFGFWEELARINDIISDAEKTGIGLGESVGAAIEKEDFPYKNISVLAAGYRLSIPITVHVGIGYDIVYQLPNCNGGAYGATSYTDFLVFAQVLNSLEGGVLMNFGSSVMAPEIFLKALSMVRNKSRQKNTRISRFTTLVCDLIHLPDNWSREAPKDSGFYYYRPWKTMLVRTVKNGGESYYVRGDHRDTIPCLWSEINELDS